MKKFSITTFGCQMNLHDSEKMAGILEAQGYGHTEDKKEADLIVLNTCSIRQKAEQKFLSQLGRLKSLKKLRPGLKVAVAGCIAQQLGGELLKRAPHVDFVIGPQNLHVLRDIGTAPKTALEENPGLAELELPVSRKERGRAWVSIMFGCDNFCTYCIVPHTRGRETSRTSESILREMQALAREGVKEVILLGQNVNSYRSDTDFPGLLRKIHTVEGIRRIRFVTSHPRDLSDALVDCIAELDKVCEHIHLPLQSGSSRILALMNRGYGLDEYREKIGKLRARVPGIAVTSDIIAGFPSETEDDHLKTLRALEDIGFDGVFAFKFSPRPGTAAAAMEGRLPEELKLRRLQDILRLQDEVTLSRNRPLKGTLQEVLIEGPSETGGGQLTGRTRTNKIVNLPGPEDLMGRLVMARILRARKHSLEGVLEANPQEEPPVRP